MLEAYSKSVNISENGSVPFTNTKLVKGCTAELQGESTVVLNKCGVYRVTFNASVTAGTAGAMSFALSKNGIIQSDTEVTETASDTTSSETFGFETFVQVPKSNNNCPCTVPTTISVENTGVAVSGDVKILIDKVV